MQEKLRVAAFQTKKMPAAAFAGAGDGADGVGPGRRDSAGRQANRSTARIPAMALVQRPVGPDTAATEDSCSDALRERSCS